MAEICKDLLQINFQKFLLKNQLYKICELSTCLRPEFLSWRFCCLKFFSVQQEYLKNKHFILCIRRIVTRKSSIGDFTFVQRGASHWKFDATPLIYSVQFGRLGALFGRRDCMGTRRFCSF